MHIYCIGIAVAVLNRKVPKTSEKWNSYTDPDKISKEMFPNL
jgi:hypothetical protein